MIVKRCLVKIRSIRCSVPVEHVLGKFKHIVGVACFAGVVAERFLILFLEVFTEGISSDYIAPCFCHSGKEEFYSGAVLLLSGKFIQPCKAYEFRNLRVCMMAGKVILLLFCRNNNFSVDETFR